MTNSIFKEIKSAYIAHSAGSAAVARDERLRAMIGHNCDDVFPAVQDPGLYPRWSSILLTGSQASRYINWLEANSDNGQEPTEIGVSLAFGKDQTLFDVYEREPERSKRFGLAMSSLGRPGGPFDSAFFVRGFD